MKQPDSVKDIAKNPGQPLAQIDPLQQIPLPPPFDKLDEEPPFAQLSEEAREKFVVLDDTIAVNIPKPKSQEEEDRLGYPAWRAEGRQSYVCNLRDQPGRDEIGNTYLEYVTPFELMVERHALPESQRTQTSLVGNLAGRPLGRAPTR